MELPFAALLQLCSPFLDLLDRLPQPQQDAFGVAFGLSSGSAPNPFLVGLAVLGLLSEAAEERPLLAVVDDAHWLDQASARALAFVARRLLAEQIVLLFATRQVDEALAAYRSFSSRPWGIEMLGRCWSRSCRLHSMNPSWRGSLSRRVETPSLCWSCRRD